MSLESRMLAGILLVVLPSVMYGGVTLLGLLTGNTPGYSDNPIRQNLWRPGMRMLVSISSCCWSCFDMLTRPCSLPFGSGSPAPELRSPRF
jgi:hypothetical protein